MAMASKILFCINDISEKVIQRRLEWPLFELHSTLQCRDILQNLYFVPIAGMGLLKMWVDVHA